MPHEVKIALRMQAFSVAMQAKSGGFDRETVATLRAMAEAQDDQIDPLVRAILTFATAFEDLQGDLNGLARAGEALVAAVDRANVPQPPDLGRKDIHG